MSVKEESEKVGLKLNIQSMKIMASRPITSWQINGGKCQIFFFRGSKTTADGDCSHEYKDTSSLEEAMTKLASILKSRDITLPTKIHIVKAMVFLVVMYRCKSWTIKKPEHQRMDAFKFWCQRRLVCHCQTEKISNLSILKEINLEYSLEGLMLKLNLQYFGYLM